LPCFFVNEIVVVRKTRNEHVSNRSKATETEPPVGKRRRPFPAELILRRRFPALCSRPRSSSACRRRCPFIPPPSQLRFDWRPCDAERGFVECSDPDEIVRDVVCWRFCLPEYIIYFYLLFEPPAPIAANAPGRPASRACALHSTRRHWMKTWTKQ